MTASKVLPSIGTATTAELRARLEHDLGPAAVSADPSRIDRLSVDWAHMSPILAEQLPAGRADLIVTPSTADHIPLILKHCYEMRVPITPRGTGLGNYGQAFPYTAGCCSISAPAVRWWRSAMAGSMPRPAPACATWMSRCTGRDRSSRSTHPPKGRRWAASWPAAAAVPALLRTAAMPTVSYTRWM